jgi:hypothetical protein
MVLGVGLVTGVRADPRNALGRFDKICLRLEIMWLTFLTVNCASEAKSVHSFPLVTPLLTEPLSIYYLKFVAMNIVYWPLRIPCGLRELSGLHRSNAKGQTAWDRRNRTRLVSQRETSHVATASRETPAVGT